MFAIVRIPKTTILICCFSLSSCIIGDRLSCWPNNVIPYRISPGFSESQISHIKHQINVINNVTCIRWLEETEVNVQVNDLVEFVRGKECFLLVKFIDKTHLVHYIQLNDYCFEEKYVVHEMMHAMGFDHEHQRADRDCYVEVDQGVVNDPTYRIVEHNYDGGWLERFPYDKYSVTHYPRDSRLKSRTERWFNLWEPLGNTKGILTAMDIWKLLYKFCNFPHYCDVFPHYCEIMDTLEKDCTHKQSIAITN